MIRSRVLVAAATLLFLLSCARDSSEGPATRGVSYSAGSTGLKGYLADNGPSDEKRPGVIVVPEWWGLEEYVKMRARMIADLGYVALAIDMYGNGTVASSPDSARRLAIEVAQNPAVERARFMAAVDFLKRQPSVDSTRIAAIGYCFGGGVALRMARAGLPLAGVVSFHGNLSSTMPARTGQIQARILVLAGENDASVPLRAVQAFREEMNAAGADYQVITFPGATHAFTNPASDSIGRVHNMPIAYHPEADRESWTDMREFLHQVLSEKP